MDDLTIKKLKEGIPTSGIKIIDLYNKIDSNLLDTQPRYQRKLVWKKQHKFAFIDTILLNFPFPEVYIASSEIDIENMVATEVVVDGQQRLTTIVDYIKGEGDFLSQKRIPKFDDLTQESKKAFLNYKVSVRDLKDIGEPIIKEVFKRINSTEYSLNVIEKSNAAFGDGEISMFIKQLVDLEFKVTEDETDIVLSQEVRKSIYDFFENNKIFTDNDKKRMYDFQYLMLISTTILEGKYFGRSSKVEEYLEKFNSSFEDSEKIVGLLNKAIEVIEKLNFSQKSYWFNKANIYTLLVEISKLNTEEIDLKKLEFQLLGLEDKVDLYFTAEDEEELVHISEDERKYFENARHGSHEKASRDHRGKVISEILKKSLSSEKESLDGHEESNTKYLEDKKIDFSSIIPTQTGLTKNIMDAISDVRDFLRKHEIHDYSIQELGPDNKVKLECYFVRAKDALSKTEMSLYRSNGRGDYRIWFSDLKSFAEPNDKLALFVKGGTIHLMNLKRIDYFDYLSSIK